MRILQILFIVIPIISSSQTSSRIYDIENQAIQDAIEDNRFNMSNLTFFDVINFGGSFIITHSFGPILGGSAFIIGRYFISTKQPIFPIWRSNYLNISDYNIEEKNIYHDVYNRTAKKYNKNRNMLSSCGGCCVAWYISVKTVSEQ